MNKPKIIITPCIVNDTRELRVATKSEETVIIIIDKDFFWEIEKQSKKTLAGKKARKVITGVGGVLATALSIITLGSAAVLFAGAFAIGKFAGAMTDDFKGYDLALDYKKQRVILKRNVGKNKYNDKTMTIREI